MYPDISNTKKDVSLFVVVVVVVVVYFGNLRTNSNRCGNQYLLVVEVGPNIFQKLSFLNTNCKK